MLVLIIESLAIIENATNNLNKAKKKCGIIIKS